jgi:hypothetical protein
MLTTAMSSVRISLYRIQEISAKLLTSLPRWRETHCAEKNNRYFDFKYLKLCAHINTSNLFRYKLCSVATPKHFGPLPLENYVRIVALAPDLRKVSFYSVIEFLYHSSTIKLLSLLILIKGWYPSFKASLPCWKSLLALWLLWHANLCKAATRVSTSNKSDPIIITCNFIYEALGIKINCG